MKARGADDDPIYAYLGVLPPTRRAPSSGACSTSAARARSAGFISPPCSTSATTTDGRRRVGAAAGGLGAGEVLALRSAASVAPRARGRRQRHAAAAGASPCAGCRRTGCRRSRRRACRSRRHRVRRRANRSPFDWARETARHVGTVAHRVFAQIARDGIAAWDASRVASLAPRIRAELAAEGVDEAELAARGRAGRRGRRRATARRRARAAGCSIPAHADARANGRLPDGTGAPSRTSSIDRTFVADGDALDRRFQDGHARRRRPSTPSSIAKSGALSRPARALRARSCACSMRARSGSASIYPLLRAAGANGRTTGRSTTPRETVARRRELGKSAKIQGFVASRTIRCAFFAVLPPSADMPIALTIGNFDGVHRGHQAMLARLIEAAEDLALPPAVLTFDPPPREFFAREQAPPRLSSLRDKIEQFARARRRAHVRRALRRTARVADAGGVHRRRARAPPRRALGAGRRGFPLRQGPDRRPRDAAPRGADVQRRGDAHGGDRRRARVVDRRPRRARGGRSRARRARCSAARSRSRAASRTARSSAATSGFRRRTCRCKRKPPVAGVFAVRVHGLGGAPRTGVASVGVRPTVSTSGVPLLEVFLFDFDDADLRPADRRRVRAQAARRGALRRPRRADAPDRAATSRKPAISSARACARQR